MKMRGGSMHPQACGLKVPHDEKIKKSKGKMQNLVDCRKRQRSLYSKQEKVRIATATHKSAAWRFTKLKLGLQTKNRVGRVR